MGCRPQPTPPPARARDHGNKAIQREEKNQMGYTAPPRPIGPPRAGGAGERGRHPNHLYIVCRGGGGACGVCGSSIYFRVGRKVTGISHTISIWSLSKTNAFAREIVRERNKRALVMKINSIAQSVVRS